MSTKIEVESVAKGCKVIIDLDEVLEIAPLVAGGCELYFADFTVPGGRSATRVKDSYSVFQQFCIQPVSSEQIAKQVAGLKKAADKIDVPEFAKKK